MSLTQPPDALDRPRPDIERHVWLAIRALGNVITWNYGDSEVDPHGWATMTQLQVDCRGPNRNRAWQMADQARRIIKKLPWAEWDEGVVCSVDCVDGPRWLPDENGGPRYIARFSIAYHPIQRAA